MSRGMTASGIDRDGLGSSVREGSGWGNRQDSWYSGPSCCPDPEATGTGRRGRHRRWAMSASNHTNRSMTAEGRQ